MKAFQKTNFISAVREQVRFFSSRCFGVWHTGCAGQGCPTGWRRAMDKQRKRTPGGRLESWRLRAITSCRSLSLGKGRFEWRGIDPRPVENPERNPETAVDHRRSSRNYSSGDNASFLPKLKEILHESQKSGVRHHFQVASCLDPNLNPAACWEHRSNTAAYAMAGPSDPSGAGLLLRFRGDVCVEDPVGEGWAVACSQSFTKRFTLIICTVALHLLTVHVFNFPTARCKKKAKTHPRPVLSIFTRGDKLFGK